MHLETVVGDLPGAERIYQRIINADDRPTRARAEATFRLAELYSRQSNSEKAKSLFLQLLRDFRDATDFIAPAEFEFMKVTADLTRDQIGANIASVQRIGDLAIALLGALENKEKERATELLNQLSATLGSLSPRSDDAAAPALQSSKSSEVVEMLRISTAAISSTMNSERGGMTAAHTQLSNSKEFEPFLRRGFPSSPNDLFAPVWRLKDRLARALARSDQKQIVENADQLEQYLAPLNTLPLGQEEGTLARAVIRAAQDVKALAQEGKFGEARKRLDDFDLERHEVFAEVRREADLPIRVPERLVAAAWVVLHRIEQARHTVSRRDDATAMDHVSEAIKVCQDVLPRVENDDVEALFRRQQAELEKAFAAIKAERTGPALQALKRASERPK